MIVGGFDIAAEVWKPIPGFADYEVSSIGRVRRCCLGNSNACKLRVLRPDTSGRYARACLYRDSRPTYHNVHRLMLVAFVGQPPSERHQGAHNDGDSFNNTLNNLRWALPKDNAADRIMHGRQPRGQHHPNSKLTPEQVIDLKAMRSRGVPYSAIAAHFGIGESTAARAACGVTYR